MFFGWRTEKRSNRSQYKWFSFMQTRIVSFLIFYVNSGWGTGPELGQDLALRPDAAVGIHLERPRCGLAAVAGPTLATLPILLNIIKYYQISRSQEIAKENHSERLPAN